MPVSVPRKPTRRADRSRPSATPPTIELLGSIVSTSPIATHAIDLDRRVLIWNPASERTFGWTAREVDEQAIEVITAREFDEHLREAFAGKPNAVGRKAAIEKVMAER